MKNLSMLFLVLFVQFTVQSQTVKVVGEVQISSSDSLTSMPGSIRWTGSDFEGWTGTEWVSFTAGQTVRDGSGNPYTTIKVGTQIWLEQNLSTEKYNDGTTIQLAMDASTWNTAAVMLEPCMTWYNDDPSTYQFPYGALYNYYAVDSGSNGGKNVCPLGYHVPNKAELDTLQSFLGGSALAGGKLKDASSLYWNSPNLDASNQSGMTIYPSGRRGPSGTFAGLGNNAYLRSTTESPETVNAHYGLLSNTTGSFLVNLWNKGIGMGVRCLRD